MVKGNSTLSKPQAAHLLSVTRDCTSKFPCYLEAVSASHNSKIGVLGKGFGTDAICALGCHIHVYGESSSFSTPCLPRLLLTRGGCSYFILPVFQVALF